MRTTGLAANFLRFLQFLLVLLLVQPTGSPADRSADWQEQRFAQALVRQRVSFLINRTIGASSIRLKDGSYATTMPFPSNADIQEIKRFGDQAVGELAAYVNSTLPMEQHVSIRFLLEFHDDSALAAVRSFAGKSKFAGVRLEAVAGLAGFPRDKIKEIVERISNTDPDPEVRAEARHVLGLSPAPRSSETPRGAFN